MEIEITSFLASEDAFEFSASVAERGENAGRETWHNAMVAGAAQPLLTTADQLDALRDHVKGFGAWDDAEIEGWSADECNALFIQMISGDIRELEACCSEDGCTIDWKKAEKLSQQGTISGSLYRGDNGKVYFYLGC